MKNVIGLPMPLLAPKARENSTPYRNTEITASAIKRGSVLEITLRLLTRPPYGRVPPPGGRNLVARR